MENTISRNKSHTFIMSCIYNYLIYNQAKIKYNTRYILESIYGKSMKNIDDFSKEIINKTIEKKQIIVSEIEKKLINWRWERVNYLAQAILIMSYVHFKYIEKIEKSIIINIAIELAKKFLDDKEYKFINGVLENVLL